MTTSSAKSCVQTSSAFSAPAADSALSPAPLSTSSFPSVKASAPPVPLTPDPFLKIKIESLKEKQRADSFFNSLDSEQAAKLIGWFKETDNEVEIWRRVTKPAPEGLGIDVSAATVRRLRDAWRAEDLVYMARSTLDVIVDMEEQIDIRHAGTIQTAMNQMLSETAFELMRKDPASPLLKELLANIQRLADLDLKRQKLQLEREKLLRKNAPAPGQHSDHVQHHRVDLNLVTQNSTPRETVVIHSEPEPQLQDPTP